MVQPQFSFGYLEEWLLNKKHILMSCMSRGLAVELMSQNILLRVKGVQH